MKRMQACRSVVWLSPCLAAGLLGCTGSGTGDLPEPDPRVVSAIEPVEPTGSVSGVLTDLFTKDPVSGATVTLLHDPSGTGRPVATTDASGFFELGDVPASPEVAIAITAPGYLSAWTLVAVPSSAGNLAQENGVAFAGPLELIPAAEGQSARVRVLGPDGVATDAATVTAALGVRFVDDGVPVGQVAGTAVYDADQTAFIVGGLPDLAPLAAAWPDARLRLVVVPADPTWTAAVLDLSLAEVIGSGTVEVALDDGVDAGPIVDLVDDDTPLLVVDSNVGDLIDPASLGLPPGTRGAIPSQLGGADPVLLTFSRPPEESTFFVASFDAGGGPLAVGAVTFTPSEEVDASVVSVAPPAGGWPAGAVVHVVVEAFSDLQGAPYTARGSFLTSPAGAIAIAGNARLVNGGGQPACPSNAAAILVELNGPVGSRDQGGTAATDRASLLAVRASSTNANVPAQNALSADYTGGSPAYAELVEQPGFLLSGYTRQLRIPWTAPFDDTELAGAALGLSLQLTLRVNDLATSSTTPGFGDGVIRGPGGAPVGTLSASLTLEASQSDLSPCAP